MQKRIESVGVGCSAADQSSFGNRLIRSLWDIRLSCLYLVKIDMATYSIRTNGARSLMHVSGLEFSVSCLGSKHSRPSNLS
jgi:hypothetical protein